MSLINKTSIRALAKSLDMRISTGSYDAVEDRLRIILETAAKKARSKKRKTILKRDFQHEPNLFTLE
jgi:histone H3/H4